MIFLGDSDWEFRPTQRLWSFSVDMSDLPCILSELPVASGHLATADDEVDLLVGGLEGTVRVAPFGRWRWRSLLAIVVV
jgi:hypothetical protein